MCGFVLCVFVWEVWRMERLIDSWPVKMHTTETFVFLCVLVCLFVCFLVFAPTWLHSRLCKTDTKVILQKNMHNTTTVVIEKACQQIICTSFRKNKVCIILLSAFNGIGTNSFTSMANEPKQYSLGFFFVCLQLKSISSLRVDLVVIVKNIQSMHFNRLKTHRNGPVHWIYLK